MADPHAHDPPATHTPWETRPAADCVVWSLTDASGAVQGPLDLAFVAGRHLNLALKEGQTALLIREGRLDAAYFTGNHDLAVGEAGPHPITLPAQLIFFDASQPWRLRWRRGSALHLRGSDADRQGLEIIGVAACRIVDPVVFYNAFLAGAPADDGAGLQPLIDTLLRARLAEHLGDLVGADLSDLALIQSRLTGMEGADLDEDLGPFGLICEDLALYTACPPSEADPATAAGQFAEALHNRV